MMVYLPIYCTYICHKKINEMWVNNGKYSIYTLDPMGSGIRNIPCEPSSGNVKLNSLQKAWILLVVAGCCRQKTSCTKYIDIDMYRNVVRYIIISHACSYITAVYCILNLRNSYSIMYFYQHIVLS